MCERWSPESGTAYDTRAGNCIEDRVACTQIRQWNRGACLRKATPTCCSDTLELSTSYDKSILNVSPDKLNTLDTVKLTTYEWKTLGEVCEVLRPFDEASTYAQLENQPSASLVIPCVLGLICKLTSIKERNNTSLVHALSASVEKIQTKFVDNDTYVTASVLEPRFKLRWARSSQHAAITDSLCRKVKILRLNSDAAERRKVKILRLNSDAAEPSPKRRRVDQPPAPVGGDLFDFLYADEPVTTESSEVEEYLDQPPLEKTSDPLQYR